MANYFIGGEKVSISVENPLKVGDKVRLTGEDWNQFQGMIVTVDEVKNDVPWSNDRRIQSLALTVGETCGYGYEVERVEETSDLTLPEKAVKIVENLTSVGFTKEQACEIAMLAVRKEAENV